MSGLLPVGGSKLFVGQRVSAKGKVTAEDFANIEWTEMGGWVNAGEIGDTQEVGEQALINESRVRKFKTVLNAGNMDNQFVPMATDPGQIKFKKAIEDCSTWAFKIEWGADCIPESEVAISVGAPAVVTWAGHGFQAGQPIVFNNEGGALPTGLVAGTVYYVVAEGLTNNAFSVSAEVGGAPVETTEAGTGTDIATAPPAGFTDMFYGLALPGSRSGGGAADLHLRNWSIAVDSNIVEV